MKLFKLLKNIADRVSDQTGSSANRTIYFGNSGCIIQTGAVQVTFTSSNYVDVTATLNYTMPNTDYRVFFSCSRNSTNIDTQPVYSLVSKTTTSFVIRCFKNNEATTANSSYVMWLAIS